MRGIAGACYSTVCLGWHCTYSPECSQLHASTYLTATAFLLLWENAARAGRALRETVVAIMILSTGHAKRMGFGLGTKWQKTVELAVCFAGFSDLCARAIFLPDVPARDPGCSSSCERKPSSHSRELGSKQRIYLGPVRHLCERRPRNIVGITLLLWHVTVGCMP